MNKIIPIFIILLSTILITNSCVKNKQISDEKPLTNEPPTSFSLENYPNPFSPFTTISYSIQDSVHVVIVMYNIEGEIVDTVENQFKLPGRYDLKPDFSLWEPGIYFYKITAGEFTEIKKMVLLK